MKRYVFIGLLFLTSFCFFDIVLAADTDKDGLADHLERDLYFTDPNNPDTDGDGYLDGSEIYHGYSPYTGNSVKTYEEDFDGDGFNNSLELKFGTNIYKLDTDGDGTNDKDEIFFGLDPLSKSTEQKFERKILVNKDTQRLFYYVNGVAVLNKPVSTGNIGTETPSGSFSISRKIDEKRYVGPGYDVPGVKWNMMFKPMYYIHGAYWHNDFGIRTHSHGCVNMTNEDAEELYRYVEPGVIVEIIGETPKGRVI